MRKYLLILISVINQLLMSSLSVAQLGTHTLEGLVLDSITREPIPFANVAVYAEGKLIQGSNTDFDGQFRLKSLSSQLISIEISVVGFQRKQLDAIEISPNQEPLIMEMSAGLKDVFTTCCFMRPARSGDSGQVGSVTMCRGGSTNTYIDGIRIRGLASMEGFISDSETDEPLPFVNIAILQDGRVITGGSTDFDGFYKIVGLLPGDYDIHVSYVGYTGEELISVQLKPNQLKELDFQLRPGLMICCVTVCEIKSPLIEKDGGCCTTISSCGLHCMGKQSRCLNHVTDSLIDDGLEVKGLHGLSVQQSMALYPNPARSQITLDLVQLDDVPLDLRIVDSSGRIVLEQQSVQFRKLSIPLDGLSDGVYFVSVQLKDKVLTERFIVAK